MNGLEAIELMKQGKLVTTTVSGGNTIIFKILNNNVYFKDIEDDGDDYQVDFAFSFRGDYEEYIDPKSLTGWHAKGKQMDFWMMHSDGDIEDEKYWHEDEYRDEDRFSTREKAEEIAFKQTLFRKLQRFSDENGGSEIDWSGDTDRKFFIFYCSVNKELDFYWHYTEKDFGHVYFISEEVVKQAIELFHDDLIKYFTHDWSGGNE